MTTTVYSVPSSAAAEPTLAICAGRVMTLAGSVFAAANLFQYGVYSGLLHLHPAALSLSWPAALIVFFTVLARLRAGGGANGRRVALWSRMAIGAQILIALGLLGVSLLRHDFTFMYWTSPVGLVIYGLAWMTAAARGGRGWMIVPSLGAFVAAGVVIALLGTPPAYLAYAAGLAAFVLLPGLWLMLGHKA
ncbi:hypothetical protein [Brevundimonas goettingensis]|uniref:Uncharacterized protein n=1 Tax=Brevundimonas goettingensis TaxID=2774190 RepID=A0A975C1F0_9CAUL|nr:hypothetical protein [Brevundimonas goettingensis]QTC91274.1 hypothetical protein IFJ75_19095 [Brevundimonas goettingensis]